MENLENTESSAKKEMEKRVLPQLLVVDDESGYRNMLSMELGCRGYPVATASSGEEAIQQAKMIPVDVVISDLTMPGLGGVETLIKLKEIDPTIEIIMMTGYATLETAEESMKRGAYDYITKPFQLKDLLRLIEKAFDKRCRYLQRGAA